MSGGDNAAGARLPGAHVIGLHNKFNNTCDFILVRIEEDFVGLYEDGSAVYLSSDGTVLPLNIPVIQRARNIAASHETEWEELHGHVITTQYHYHNDNGGQE